MIREFPQYPVTMNYGELEAEIRKASQRIRGNPLDDPEAQAASVFGQIEKAVVEAGGDFRHLAKATYYITEGKSPPAGMDVVRRKVFDPKRPPAASRNNLRHVGGDGGVMAVDMIGVRLKP